MSLFSILVIVGILAVVVCFAALYSAHLELKGITASSLVGDVLRARRGAPAGGRDGSAWQCSGDVLALIAADSSKLVPQLLTAERRRRAPRGMLVAAWHEPRAGNALGPHSTHASSDSVTWNSVNRGERLRRGLLPATGLALHLVTPSRNVARFSGPGRPGHARACDEVHRGRRVFIGVALTVRSPGRRNDNRERGLGSRIAKFIIILAWWQNSVGFSGCPAREVRVHGGTRVAKWSRCARSLVFTRPSIA